MKILRLDLLAFGPFTGESLALHEGQHGLHIIHGPNEAGKSSSLRALRQLLYGIPHNSSDNFVHPHQNLRIGALLEKADGRRLDFVRRKGRSKTLRGAGDADAIDPSALTEMLGGVDEVTFCQRFGIDYEELRRGGEAVARGGGDLGEVLFAAGAGVADLGLVQKRLDDEADELFKARGSVQRINKAISELAAVRRTIKDSQLLTSDWVKHDKALRANEKRQAEIDEQLLKTRSQKNRLERIDRALPLIARRRRSQEQLAEVGDAPLLPEDFSGNRRQAITEQAGAQQAEREASKTIERLETAIAELHVPPGLLEHRTAITALHTGLGSYQKAARDRPGLVAQLESAEQRMRTILQDLGRPAELQQVEQLRIGRAQRQRIQSLAEACTARIEKRSSAGGALRRLHDKIKRAESRLAAAPAIQDAGELRRVIRQAQKHGDLGRQLDQARVDLQSLEKQADVDLKKLRLWNGTLQQLEQLPVPALETVERFENQIADAASAEKRSEERRGELMQQAQKLDQSLEKLRLEHDVPSEDDLALARHRRDDGWQLVRSSLRAGPPADQQKVLEFVDQFAPGDDLAQAFQASVEAADAIADRLRREADRVAEKAKLAADRQDLDRQLGEQKQECTAAQQALAQLRSQWRDQWTQLGIEPLTPREMRPWLNQQHALVRTAEAIRKQRDAVDSSTELVRSLGEDLNRCLTHLQQPLMNEVDTLAGTLERCEAVVHEIESANQQRLECEKNLEKLRDELAEANQDAEEAERDFEQWRVDWSEAVTALGLDRDAAPSEANSVIAAIDELLGTFKDVGGLSSRIQGIEHDAEEFEQAVQRLLAQIAEDLLALPVDQAVADLYDRLEATSTAQTRLVGWKEQLEAEESKRDQAQSKVKQLQAEIQAMCQQAGCGSQDELPAAEERSARRREIEKELKTIDEQLDELAAGGSIDELIAEAQHFEADRLRADVLQLGEEIAALESEKVEVAEAIGGEKKVRKSMDGSGRAAEAQDQAEHLLASIRADAEQYIRLRLASAILRRSIERFRDASQGPVLARAGELFAELTLGSFAGLRADYDDKDHAVLVGIRAAGQTVGVDGMSDGTCDQLYLALRLALLEQHLDGREPLPFIVDDILIMFDDDRAVAALKILARLSERMQVVFFTHHDHLVRLASDKLDDDVLFTHTLAKN